LYNIVGYQAGGIYKESTISYHDFKKAFDNNFLDKTENYWADWIFMFQYNSKAKYDFNISLVKFLIGEYLDSINTLEQNNRFSNSNNERVYGISVLNKIHEDLDYIKCGKMCFGNIPNDTLDIRVFSIVKEHKKIMVERLKYINEHVINIYDLIYSYENILDLSEQCFHLALKYNLTFSNILLERISEKIDGIRDSEKLILGRLMDRI
jgi:hypothetical protein